MLQNIFGNMINNTQDLEWFMTNFIRKYEELENKFERYDGETIEDIERDKRDNEIYYENQRRRLEEEILELREEKKVLIDKFMELWELIPEQRFGQIIENYLRFENQDLFYIKNEVILAKLDYEIERISDKQTDRKIVSLLKDNETREKIVKVLRDSNLL